MSECMMYLHGMGGHPNEAYHFRDLCECEIFGIDYHGIDPWDVKAEILTEYDSLSKKFAHVSVIAVSLGAYFCMDSLNDKNISRAFFISPVVNMEMLILGMMSSAGVSESDLQAKQEIDTPYGAKLSWKYLEYVRAHPLKWTAPTWILHAEKDNLIPVGRVREFSQEHHAALTVMQDGDHWFHTEEQLEFLDEWFRAAHHAESPSLHGQAHNPPDCPCVRF